MRHRRTPRRRQRFPRHERPHAHPLPQQKRDLAHARFRHRAENDSGVGGGGEVGGGKPFKI